MKAQIDKITEISLNGHFCEFWFNIGYGGIRSITQKAKGIPDMYSGVQKEMVGNIWSMLITYCICLFCRRTTSRCYCTLLNASKKLWDIDSTLEGLEKAILKLKTEREVRLQQSERLQKK
ncbi:hypothetical protein POM88_015258 [Heracleum sosnowskyi]|uniref:Uncharacterized protein n=1 Tax=Heracleum sosnowskyi TaxID=360622 RepID=A0AAD8IJV2_9APIA|nr:hypothetical protein POM88_015258 [Heracleum sosnowskyi]